MRTRLLSLLRVIAAFLYLAHGTQKLFGFPGDSAPVHYLSLYGLAGLIETGCGTLLLLGLFTRWAGLLAATEMVIAYGLVHAPRGFWPLLNHGELALLYCFVFLYMAFAGPGPWSLDRLVAERSVVRTTGARRFR